MVQRTCCIKRDKVEMVMIPNLVLLCHLVMLELSHQVGLVELRLNEPRVAVPLHKCEYLRVALVNEINTSNNHYEI